MNILVLFVLFAMAVAKPPKKARISLLDNLKAPLIAELDMSDMDKKIQTFIETEIELQVNHTKHMVEALIETESRKIEELTELENEMVANYSRSLNKLHDVYQSKLTVTANKSQKSLVTSSSHKKSPGIDVGKLSDGKDQDFVVIFHQGYRGSFSYYVPKILVSSTKTAHLSVYYFANNKNTSVTIDKDHFELNLEKNVLMHDGISNAGILIHADASLTLYGFLFHQSSYYVSEGFLVIPTRYTSRKFVIPSYSNFEDKSIIAITPLYDNSVVNIQLRLKGTLTYKNVKYNNNDIIKLVLAKYSTLQLSSTSDLSGTMVTASKPVIVVSGNTLTRTLSDKISGSDAQPFIEMVLPTDQLDKLYIIPVISTRSNNTIRIQAVNSTNLTLNIGNQKLTKSLNSRDHYDFYHTQISHVRSSTDILVTLYPQELSDNNGDSFMMTIHGVNQYLPEYDFAVPTGFDSFISITVSSDAVDGFIVDGKHINISTIFSISEYSTFSMAITSGVHRIIHSRKQRFGLWVYGNHKLYDAYGYPAGIAFRTRN